MCGISKSSFLAVGAGAILAGLALAPVASNAWAGEKTGAKPGAKPSAATSNKLAVGSKAPEFFPSKWIKGEPVKSFAQGKVYVVEFWTTWCPPCRESIPHLTEFQKQFKDDVTIIGMASSERVGADGKDDRFNKASKFVKDQGDKMNYRVAFEADQKVSKAWLGAAGVDYIPAAFIVGGDGKIVWFGNPLEPAFEKNLTTAVEALKADDKSTKKSSDSEKH
ncbi:MAG: TlpA family protein disulfide reductase [Phycisphaerales bacterium]